MRDELHFEEKRQLYGEVDGLRRALNEAEERVVRSDHQLQAMDMEAQRLQAHVRNCALCLVHSELMLLCVGSVCVS